MTFWHFANSDFPKDQTFHQFNNLYTEFDLHRTMSGFHGAFATGVACQQGTLTLLDTWFRPPFWDFLLLLLRPDSSNLSCLYSTFHLEYPLLLSRFCFVKKRSFQMLFTFTSCCILTTCWVSILVDHRSQRASNAWFDGRFGLPCSVWEHPNFVLKSNYNVKLYIFFPKLAMICPIMRFESIFCHKTQDDTKDSFAFFSLKRLCFFLTKLSNPGF